MLYYKREDIIKRRAEKNEIFNQSSRTTQKN